MKVHLSSIEPVSSLQDIDVVPQAIFDIGIDSIAAALGRTTIESHDDLDRFTALDFLSGIVGPFSMRWYHGHPAGTTTLYLPASDDDDAHIHNKVSKIIHDPYLAPLMKRAKLVWIRGQAVPA